MRIEARHSRRLQAICLLGGLFAAVLIVRLLSLQLWAGAAYSARAENQHVKRTVLQASRGRILDRHGRVLATNLEAQSFFVNNVSELDNLRAIAVRFSRRNGESGAGMLKRMREKRSFVWLARKVMDGPPEEQVPEGVGRMVEMRRTYPMGTLSGQVLGYTDIDNVGIEGIEMAYNKLLTGTPGEMASRVDARGKVLGAMGTVHRMPEDGGDLILTLDADYQSIAEEELAVAVSEFEAKNGIALVTDPRTGEILAMANVPLYDPNAFTKFAQEKRRNR
ncbi:MAG: penicillin-binding transpeptidase domain-containing protein, partial [bacterium]|nr:penicillin-binding transpeptidase domain-containing protein [bacterium]